MMPLLIYLFIVNVLAFFLMLTDKQRAIKKKWRIPESLLFSVAAVGGSLGGLLGMHLCHHKTRHLRFRSGLPLILTLHLAIAFLVVLLKYYR